MELIEKIDRSIKLLKSIKSDEIELSYSGGKDSDVILELAKMADIRYRAIYKKTTIDPAGTIKHCRENGVEIREPKIRFFDLIKQNGFPTRRARFCCEDLKEYKILDNAIQGIRRCESVKRMKRYKEPIVCRIYGNKKNHVNVVLPILEWTDRDISDFIAMQNIQCHPLYYDANGHFNVKKRLGCRGCPLQADNGLSDFKETPNLVKAWINAGQEWWDKPREKPPKCHSKFESIYDLFVHNVFFNSYESFSIVKEGAFGKMDCKEALESYFKIKL
ncbi:phosphoadenosine phosphosulfate reductase family protein [Bacteroides caccae]|uniref:phosphoadenosine phosphosulfate reductase domain-containing protein n=1 Tax=Bacteroides caccae TaxID=47678 RepID=UPI00291D089E|nr:phosphoadenosine phosphosulfate reductase [uncultured phage]CAJ1862322.1 phosphoadenosine phosphosulfate reductase [uncultured phage]CAJ1863919.1 phosphoadenosine phosphosulfate reductase [uncultured phage]CAJ1889980.1 phosphoadenosine phosphosulfate reductase [uncultured phage]